MRRTQRREVHQAGQRNDLVILGIENVAAIQLEDSTRQMSQRLSLLASN